MTPDDDDKNQAMAVADLKAAVAFFDKVKNATAAERAAVGRDHWDWLERAARRVSDAFPSCAGCDGSGYASVRLHSELACNICCG